MSGPTLRQAYDLCRNAGTVVAVGMPPAGTTVEFDGFQLFSTEKRLVGCYYGSGQVRRDFPRLVALAEGGQLDLAGAVTRRITLDQVNEAFDAMASGEVIRSVIVPGAGRPWVSAADRRDAVPGSGRPTPVALRRTDP